MRIGSAPSTASSRSSHADTAATTALVSGAVAIATFRLAPGDRGVGKRDHSCLDSDRGEAAAIARQGEATTEQVRLSREALGASVQPWLYHCQGTSPCGCSLERSKKSSLRVLNWPSNGPRDGPETFLWPSSSLGEEEPESPPAAPVFPDDGPGDQPLHGLREVSYPRSLAQFPRRAHRHPTVAGPA